MLGSFIFFLSSFSLCYLWLGFVCVHANMRLEAQCNLKGKKKIKAKISCNHVVPEAGELNKIVIRILKGQKSVKPAVHPYKLARRAECPKHPGCRQDKIHPAMMENKHFIFLRLLVCRQLFPCPWHVSQRLSTMGTGGAARSRRQRQWEGKGKAVPARWRFHVAPRCTCLLTNRQPCLG